MSIIYSLWYSVNYMSFFILLVSFFSSILIGCIAAAPIHSFLKKHAIKISGNTKTGIYGIEGEKAIYFNKLHADDEKEIPRMGGIVVGIPVVILSMILALVGGVITPLYILLYITWAIGFILGYYFDFKIIDPSHNELLLRERIPIIIVLSLAIGYLAYNSFGVGALSIPFLREGGLFLSFWILVPFVIVSLSLFASGVIDGIDALSHVVWVSIFTTYAIIAALLNLWEITLFLTILVGGMLVFLWKNISPAQWYGGEVAQLSYAFTLLIVVFFTDAYAGGFGVLLLPLIAFPLVFTVLSVIIQVYSKRFRSKKILYSAPVHHHFEAMGIPPSSIVFYYGIISFCCGVLGILFTLLLL